MLVIKLEEVFKKRGLTEKDLTAQGVNRNTLKALLSGRNTRIEFAVLEQLCKILGCQPGDLLEYRP